MFTKFKKIPNNLFYIIFIINQEIYGEGPTMKEKTFFVVYIDKNRYSHDSLNTFLVLFSLFHFYWKI